MSTGINKNTDTSWMTILLKGITPSTWSTPSTPDCLQPCPICKLNFFCSCQSRSPFSDKAWFRIWARLYQEHNEKYFKRFSPDYLTNVDDPFRSNINRSSAILPHRRYSYDSNRTLNSHDDTCVNTVDIEHLWGCKSDFEFYVSPSTLCQGPGCPCYTCCLFRLEQKTKITTSSSFPSQLEQEITVTVLKPCSCCGSSALCLCRTRSTDISVRLPINAHYRRDMHLYQQRVSIFESNRGTKSAYRKCQHSNTSYYSYLKFRPIFDIQNVASLSTSFTFNHFACFNNHCKYTCTYTNLPHVMRFCDTINISTPGHDSGEAFECVPSGDDYYPLFTYNPSNNILNSKSTDAAKSFSSRLESVEYVPYVASSNQNQNQTAAVPSGFGTLADKYLFLQKSNSDSNLDSNSNVYNSFRIPRLSYRQHPLVGSLLSSSSTSLKSKEGFGSVDTADRLVNDGIFKEEKLEDKEYCTSDSIDGRFSKVSTLLWFM